MIDLKRPEAATAAIALLSRPDYQRSRRPFVRSGKSNAPMADAAADGAAHHQGTRTSRDPRMAILNRLRLRRHLAGDQHRGYLRD
jgi:hypothetical protein